MKIAIVQKSNNKVQTTYEADSIEIGRFGGPWGDPNVVEHVKIPQELESEPIENLVPSNSKEQVDVRLEQDGYEDAYDSKRQLLRDSEGNVVTVPKYIEVPVMRACRLMKRR